MPTSWPLTWRVHSQSESDQAMQGGGAVVAGSMQNSVALGTQCCPANVKGGIAHPGGAQVVGGLRRRAAVPLRLGGRVVVHRW